MPATNYPETGYQSTDLFTYLRQNAYVIPVAHAQKFLAENQEMVKPYFLYEDQPGPHEPRITAVIQRNSNGSMYLETLFVQQCFSQRRLAPDYASDLNAQPLELWGPAIQERNDPVILIVQIRVSLAQELQRWASGATLAQMAYIIADRPTLDKVIPVEATPVPMDFD